MVEIQPYINDNYLLCRYSKMGIKSSCSISVLMNKKGVYMLYKLNRLHCTSHLTCFVCSVYCQVCLSNVRAAPCQSIPISEYVTDVIAT